MSARSGAGALTPKQPAWAISTTTAGVVILVVYVALAWSAPWKPGRLGGLVAGTAAAALFVNAALYPARRRLGAWPLGTARRWLQLHIYGSVLAVLLVLVHMGFEWPAGTFGWLLCGLTVWTVLTGAVGVYLQKSLPVALARNLKVEAIYERIPALVDQLVQEADAVMLGASDVMTRVYRTEIRPVIARPMPRWSYVMDMTAGRARQTELLSRIGRYLEGLERDRIVALDGIVNDKFDLDAHMSVQRALRTWLVTHVPPAMVLMGLLVVHVFAVLYF
jgi:hypothetical protein